MTGKSSAEKESRGRMRLLKTAALRVKQQTYPMTSDSDEAAILLNLNEKVLFFSGPPMFGKRSTLSQHGLGGQHHKKGVALLMDESLASAPLSAIAEVVCSRKMFADNRIEIGARYPGYFTDDLKPLKTCLANIRYSSEYNK